MPISVAGSGAITGASTINGLTMPSDAIAPGLVLINKTDFSAASSVSVNNCFTSTYDNYRIEINAIWGGSGAGGFAFRARINGSDITTVNEYVSINIYAEDAVAATKAYTRDTYGLLGTVGNQQTDSAFDVLSPALSTRTICNGSTYERSTANARLDVWGINRETAAPHDGFTIYPTTSTMTGTVRVYGYRNS